MNDNEKISRCKETMREALAKFPKGRTPAFIVEHDSVEIFSLAAQEMMGEFIAHQTLPVILVDGKKVAEATTGSTQMFFVITLLAETLSKITRRDATKIVESFARSAEEMVSTMSTDEIMAYCQKYGLFMKKDI